MTRISTLITLSFTTITSNMSRFSTCVTNRSPIRSSFIPSLSESPVSRGIFLEHIAYSLDDCSRTLLDLALYFLHLYLQLILYHLNFTLHPGNGQLQLFLGNKHNRSRWEDFAGPIAIFCQMRCLGVSMNKLE